MQYAKISSAHDNIILLIKKINYIYPLKYCLTNRFFSEFYLQWYNTFELRFNTFNDRDLFIILNGWRTHEIYSKAVGFPFFFFCLLKCTNIDNT